MYRKAKIKIKTASYWEQGKEGDRRVVQSKTLAMPSAAFCRLLYHLQRADLFTGVMLVSQSMESRKGKRACSKEGTYLTWKWHIPPATHLMPLGPHLAVRML